MYNAKPSIVSILNEQIKEGKWKPAYLFYGDEEYLKQHYLKQFTSAFSGGADAVVMEGGTFSLDVFEDAVENVSFSLSGNVVVIRNLELAKNLTNQQKARFLASLSELDGSSMVFLYYDAMFLQDASYDIVAKRKDMLKTLAKYAFSCEFKEQTESELTKWIVRGFSAKKLRIGEKAVKRLLEVAGGDMTNLKSEMEKISILAEGEVTVKTVDEATSVNRKTDVFGLARDILNGKTQDALRKLSDCRLLSEEPVGILSIVASTFTEAALVKSGADSGIRNIGDIIAAFGLNEKKRRFLEDYLHAPYDSRFLNKSLIILLETDKKMKESAADKWGLMEAMCVRIALCKR